MLLQKRIDRAFKYQAEENAREREATIPYESENNDLQPEPQDLMEKGDMFAMVVSALLVLVPAALGVLLLMALACWLFI